MISHHPDSEILMDYGTGSLSEGLALVVATHVAMCPNCFAQLRFIEACGAVLLDSVAASSMSDTALKGVLERLGTPPDPEPTPEILGADAGQDVYLPAPLRRYLTRSLADLGWRPVGSLFEEHRLSLAGKMAITALCRIPAATRIPPTITPVRSIASCWPDRIKTETATIDVATFPLWTPAASTGRL